MPICVPNHLPAIELLRQENIFVMPASRANQQDIRPLRILLLNLMPKKIETETQFIRLLSNTSLQLHIQLLRIDHYETHNTPTEHLNSFYCHFNEIREQNFDGLIITGAPLEFIDYTNIRYWQNLKEIIQWSTTHVTSTLFICWAVQAALHLLYDFPKILRNEKLSGIFMHQTNNPYNLLTRGFDEQFLAPHSRYIDFPTELIKQHTDLSILAQSGYVNSYLMSTLDKRRVFVTGHPEYDINTLAAEYFRDKAQGLQPKLPEHYFPENNAQHAPVMTWRSHAHLLFANWLNYYVYQITPFNLTKMDPSVD